MELKILGGGVTWGVLDGRLLGFREGGVNSAVPADVEGAVVVGMSFAAAVRHTSMSAILRLEEG
jgi:hypothetical protein